MNGYSVSFRLAAREVFTLSTRGAPHVLFRLPCRIPSLVEAFPHIVAAGAFSAGPTHIAEGRRKRDKSMLPNANRPRNALAKLRKKVIVFSFLREKMKKNTFFGMARDLFVGSRFYKMLCVRWLNKAFPRVGLTPSACV